MAEPYDSATTLIDLQNILQNQYFRDFIELQVRNHDDLNKLFGFDPEPVVGKGKEFQMETAPGDTVRANIDPLADVASPNSFQADAITYRWNQNDSTAHDFCRLSASAQVDYYTIENGGNGAIVDAAARIFNQVSQQYPESLAVHRLLGRNPIVGLVNGTPVQDDNFVFADGAATPTNTTGARFAVDSTSIGYFRTGQILDIYDNTNSDFPCKKVEVDYVNYVDNSIGVKYNSSGLPARQSSGDLANIADNDQIFFSGERNAGMYSIGAYMADPDADSSFIGGITRTDVGKRHHIPHRSRENAASAVLDKSHINGAARTMQYRRNNNNGAVVICQIDLHDTLRDSYGEDAFVPMPNDAAQKKRFAHLGFVGLNYQHPTFGMLQIMSHSLYTPGVVDILTPNRWKMVSYGNKDLRWIPNDAGGSPWYRVESATPGNGRSLIFKADALSNVGDYCTVPQDNCRILSVTAQ